MSESAYARAGVDTDQADVAVKGLVEVLKAIDPGRPSRSVVGSGHYAAVLRLDDKRGLALSTDGVGTKIIVAEQMGKLDTVGIDCIAMNVNDVICVGADPIAVLDYVAVEDADPERLRQIALGLRAGAEDAGIEIPGGELAVLPELIKGHPSPGGFDLVGTCVGLVDLDAVINGSAIEPGDAVIGLPSSGVHSNGFTLARNTLTDLDEAPPELEGRTVGQALLEPTVIYVRAVRDLLASGVDARGLAHITSGGLLNLLRLDAPVGYRIDAPLPLPPVLALIAERSGADDAELMEVFNMGCGFCCVVPDGDAAEAVELLGRRHPGATVIGRATATAGVVELPASGLIGKAGQGFRPA